MDKKSKTDVNRDVVLRGLPDRDVYRFSEIAQYLIVCEKTVRDYVTQGYLKKVKHKGVVWIPRSSIIEFMQSKLGVQLGTRRERI